jgi:GTP-binding protein Era
VVDAQTPDEPSERYCCSKSFAQQRTPVLLALNKIDQVQRPDPVKLRSSAGPAFPFAAVVPISAKSGEQVDRSVGCHGSRLARRAALFSTRQPDGSAHAFIAAEIVREKVSG